MSKARNGSFITIIVVVLLLTGCKDDAADQPDGDGVQIGNDASETDLSLDFGTIDDEQDTGGPSLNEWQRQGICEEHCSLIRDCGQQEDFGGEQCEADCEAALSESDDYLANITCVTDSECDQLDRCAEPIPVPEHCFELCEGVFDCDLSETFNLPDEEDLCPYFCAGAIPSDEEFAGVVECISSALADDCDILTVMGCVNEGIDCEQVCEPIGDCERGAPVFDTFGDAEACMEHCEGLRQGQRYGLAFCLQMSECGPESCDDLPNSPAEGCDDACAAATELCGAANDEAAIQQAACEWLCTGLTGSSIPSDPSDAADCVETYDECPQSHREDRESEGGEDDASFSYVEVLVICSMDPSDDCRTACETIVGCDPDDMDLPQCFMGCTNAEIEEPETIAVVLTCVEDAEDEGMPAEVCAAVLACVPDD